MPVLDNLLNRLESRGFAAFHDRFTLFACFSKISPGRLAVQTERETYRKEGDIFEGTANLRGMGN